MNISIRSPIDGVIKVFHEIYPDKRCLIVYTNSYIPNLDDGDDSSQYLGWCQSWIDDDGQPSWRILISGLASTNDSVGILIHELGHIIGGYKHDENFRKAVASILSGYLEWVKGNLEAFAPEFELDDICNEILYNHK